MVACTVGSQSVQRQRTVGRPLAGSVAEASVGEVVEIARPDGRTDSVGLARTTDDWGWLYDDTDISGIYQVRTTEDSPLSSNGAHTGDGTKAREKGTVPGEPQPFAVNVDPAESDLARLDPQQLPDELRAHHESPDATSASAGGITSRAAWGVDLLWAALMLVLLELWLAWHFGRGVI